VDVLATLVSGRFSRPAELLDATERLGVDTLLSTSADKAGQARRRRGRAVPLRAGRLGQRRARRHAQ
jgi:hypothetical protein